MYNVNERFPWCQNFNVVIGFITSNGKTILFMTIQTTRVSVYVVWSVYDVHKSNEESTGTHSVDEDMKTNNE